MVRVMNDIKSLLKQLQGGRSLKWTYHTPGTENDLNSCIPDFREDVVSFKSYPITRENVLFSSIIRRKVMSMVQMLLLPLPKAHKLIPEIVARWNRSKGRVDEMTCYLDGMTFYFSKGYVKAAAGEQKRRFVKSRSSRRTIADPHDKDTPHQKCF